MLNASPDYPLLPHLALLGCHTFSIIAKLFFAQSIPSFSVSGPCPAAAATGTPGSTAGCVWSCGDVVILGEDLDLVGQGPMLVVVVFIGNASIVIVISLVGGFGGLAGRELIGKSILDVGFITGYPVWHLHGAKNVLIEKVGIANPTKGYPLQLFHLVMEDAEHIFPPAWRSQKHVSQTEASKGLAVSTSNVFNLVAVEFPCLNPKCSQVPPSNVMKDVFERKGQRGSRRKPYMNCQHVCGRFEHGMEEGCELPHSRIEIQTIIEMKLKTRQT
jgi:hypothetical protein